MNHISIEGMDGVGKSTICKLLAAKLNFQFIEKPLHYLFNDLFEEIKAIDIYQKIAKKVNGNLNRNFTSLFYSLGSIYMYDLFNNKNIITDRHLASNYAWSGTDYNEDVYQLVLKKIGTPKYTFILYATKDEIIKRLKSRDPNDKDIPRANHSEEIYNKMITFCKRNNFPFMKIDTTNLTPENIVDIIISKLNETK